MVHDARSATRADSREISVPGIGDARSYVFASPNAPAEALNERAAATRIASHLPVDLPHLAFVNGTAAGAFETLDRVASVATYTGTVAYPNNGFAIALRTVAGSIVQGTGTRVYWVQTGGFDTHAGQGAQGGGAYANLIGTFGDGIAAFYKTFATRACCRTRSSCSSRSSAAASRRTEVRAPITAPPR